MPEIVLGTDVPHLLVILQAGVTQSFGITIQVEPADLIGVDAKLVLDKEEYVAVLSGSTYTWTFTDIEVAEITTRSSALLSLVNLNGQTLLGRGIVEVRS